MSEQSKNGAVSVGERAALTGAVPDRELVEQAKRRSFGSLPPTTAGSASAAIS